MVKPVVAVVEGDPVIALLMDEFLMQEGYATHIWTESKGAVQFVQSLMPDLVILDLWIRRRGDGCSVLEQLRQEPSTRTIPIILCSTDPQMLQEHAAALRASDCDVLAKPFIMADLLALVTASLKLSTPSLVDVH